MNGWKNDDIVAKKILKTGHCKKVQDNFLVIHADIDCIKLCFSDMKQCLAILSKIILIHMVKGP